MLNKPVTTPTYLTYIAQEIQLDKDKQTNKTNWVFQVLVISFENNKIPFSFLIFISCLALWHWLEIIEKMFLTSKNTSSFTIKYERGRWFQPESLLRIRKYLSVPSLLTDTKIGYLNSINVFSACT